MASLLRRQALSGRFGQKGYRGFFLDTLDSYRLAQRFDEAAQQQGPDPRHRNPASRFPGNPLILNRGFEIVPRLVTSIHGRRRVDFSGLERGASATKPSRPADREWLLGQLNQSANADGIDISQSTTSHP
jgi:hypothetical protein